MLKPKFLLTKTVPVDIYRTTASTYSFGELVPGTTTVVPRDLNVQPLKDDELMLLPEADRTKDWLKVYSAEDLRNAQEGTNGWSADEFVWQGYRYKVMKVKSYNMGTLNHYRALAARIELTPN